MASAAIAAPAGAGSLMTTATPRRTAEVALAVGVVAIIALLVVPLPPFLLDLLLAGSIASALVVLLVTLGLRDPLEFSSFPAVLFILTLFRLGLNVGSTRLILGDGHAGHIIEAFGEFILRGNYVVGIVVFLILLAINFVVITKGAGRVAEVAARFTLDAMPGKQMAIDADLSAGMIDETEARRRREQVAQQADFYGAMDGASKFVKGDAIAALLITGINIVGGIIIGVLQKGLDLSTAANKYVMLTVGEGLVSQVPALIISVAAGLMVTNSSTGNGMGDQITGQLGRQPRALWITSGVLASFALVPGLPALPFLALAGTIAFVARTANAAVVAEQETTARVKAAAETPAAPAPADPMQDLLQVDPIELEVGYALIPLIDESQGGDLLERISLLRKQAAQELGILVPPIRIRDDIRLPANEYVVKVRGAEIARAEVLPRFLMALDTGGVLTDIDGMETTDPSFGMPARWIAASARIEAEAAGWVVVEPSTVVATHLMEALKGHAAELLGRQDVQEMVDALKKTHPALVEELVPARLSLGILHRVLQRLLRERVPIRDLVTILEALGDGIDTVRDPEQLGEIARRALATTISRLFLDATGSVRGITIGPRLEAALTGLFTPRGTAQGSALLNPDALAMLLRDLNTLAAQHAVDGRPLPLITPPTLRTGVRRLIEPVLPGIPVISLAELPPSVNLTAVATWEVSHAV
ncbi:MAG: flagellar biosynthesis protein FlhA [Gemmatimonadaceae bacterium]|nr:flagellar biosynthesis protein FlhA [Gemmatimonadaceae bacterium]